MPTHRHPAPKLERTRVIEVTTERHPDLPVRLQLGRITHRLGVEEARELVRRLEDACDTHEGIRM